MAKRWLYGVVLGWLTVGLVSCWPLGTVLPEANLANLPPCVDDTCYCGDFLSQTQAQAVLDAVPGDPHRLDGDRDGLACESLPSQPPARDPAGPPSNNPHLGLGNPSNAGVTNPNNYLIERPQYALAYSRDRNLLQWASWDVHAGWLGSVPRQNDFRPDGSLPQGFYQVTPTDYRGSGYDRGHIVPSGDRTNTVRDNSATFLMTNILPQTPENNRGPWRELEEYGRSLVYQYDKTLHVFAGAYGQRGRLGDRGIVIPSRLWKIILVYDRRADGSLGLDATSEVIAVDMPNHSQLSPNWQDYRTTIHRIEVATGHRFLENLPPALQAQLKQSAAVTP